MVILDRKAYHKEYNQRDYVKQKSIEREQQPKRKRAMYTRHLKRRYNISFDEFTKMLIEQLGHCSICDTTMNRHQEPHVDHDHKTGKVRSLLCFTCNVLIGNAKEDIERLKKAISYLEKYSEILSAEY